MKNFYIFLLALLSFVYSQSVDSSSFSYDYVPADTSVHLESFSPRLMRSSASVERHVTVMAYLNGIFTLPDVANTEFEMLMLPFGPSTLPGPYNQEIKQRLFYNETNGPRLNLKEKGAYDLFIECVQQAAQEKLGLNFDELQDKRLRGLLWEFFYTATVHPYNGTVLEPLAHKIAQFYPNMIKYNALVQFHEHTVLAITDAISDNIFHTRASTKAKLTEDFLKAFDESYENSRLIVIPHSQGNLYFNEVYHNVPEEYRNSIGSMHLASPSSFINGPYYSNDNDVVTEFVRKYINSGIPPSSANELTGVNPFGNDDEFHHYLLQAYFGPGLKSRDIIIDQVKTIAETLPFWSAPVEKNLTLEKIRYDGAAVTELYYQKESGAFAIVGRYHGYDILDPSTYSFDDAKIVDGHPVFAIISYHRGGEFGPYTVNTPGMFKKVLLDDIKGTWLYTYSDAWSPGSYDDGSFFATYKATE